MIYICPTLFRCQKALLVVSPSSFASINHRCDWLECHCRLHWGIVSTFDSLVALRHHIGLKCVLVIFTATWWTLCSESWCIWVRRIKIGKVLFVVSIGIYRMTSFAAIVKLSIAIDYLLRWEFEKFLLIDQMWCFHGTYGRKGITWCTETLIFDTRHRSFLHPIYVELVCL